LSISADTPRLQGLFQGQFEYDKYAIASDQDQLFANLFASGLITAVPNYLFVDLNSAVTQASRFGGTGFAPVSQVVPQSQLTQAFTSSVSPYLRESYKGLVDTELRYRFSSTNFSGNTGSLNTGIPVVAPGFSPFSALTDSTFNEGTLTVATGRDFERLLSKLTLDASRFDASSLISNTRVSGYDDLEYRLAPTVAALGRIGYENIHYPSLSVPSTVGILWQVGGRLDFGPDNQYAIVRYGKQEGIYGFSGSLRYEITPTTVLTAEASQGLGSQQEETQNALTGSTLDVYGRIVDQYNLPTAFVNPEFALQNSVFRARQYRAGITTAIGVNRFFLFASYDHRSYLGSIAPPSTSIGGNFTWSRDIRPDLNGTMSLGFANLSNLTLVSATLPTLTTFSSNGNTATASIGLNYLFTPTLTGSVTYSFIYQTGVAASSATRAGDVLTNRLDFALTKSF
jgi:uncharacterized protein (PEP-CTERM system associated)